MKEQDLKTDYPLSNLYILKKNVGLILLGLFMVLLWIGINHPASPLHELSFPGYVERYRIIISCFCFVLIFRILYIWLYQRKLRYEIRSSSFHFTKGILIQNEVSIPFENITDIFIKRNFFDVIFNLATIEISSASDYANEFAHIEGLSSKSALNLTKYLRQILNDPKS